MSEHTMKCPISFTVGELAQRGKDNIPKELISNTHLIYSSPAALAFNSPGAEGFGVKRAALSIPGSVMLLVAPGCCGRNTSLVSRLPGYDNRFFYLQMDETDIVTGRHLRKIPKKVEELYNSLDPKPSVVMICITCVDALLGTDMERVCRKAEEKIGIPVRPSYMYALTREGRKPPMVHVRQSLYSLLKPQKKRGNVVNILGFFAPLEDDCELYELLHAAGVKTIHEISRCKDLEEFQTMSQANFNLVLNPEARFAAKDFEERLSIPSIELRRMYQPDKIHSQYQALARVLGVPFDDEAFYDKTRKRVKAFREKYGKVHFSIGECMNGDPFELALALSRMGFVVDEIFGTITDENFIYIKKLQELSPDTMVYSNLEPTMIYYGIDSERNQDIEGESNHGMNDRSNCEIKDKSNSAMDRDSAFKNNKDSSFTHNKESACVHVAIGKDAGYYHPTLPNLLWNRDQQPFGFAGVIRFFDELEEVLEDKLPSHPAPKSVAEFSITTPVLTPCAPDQSGAVSVLFELGGISVICDAGGCVGNICGFDEPRWFGQKSAIFSAGLRDMDAILGRDERLVEKLIAAQDRVEANFAAIIGTPVPSVIGTDYHALRRMAEKKTGLPILTIDTNGMELYDVGEEKAYVELLRIFAGKTSGQNSSAKKIIGVFGVTPLNFSDISAGDKLRAILQDDQTEIRTYGMGCSLDAIRDAANVTENLVVSASGLEAAKYLEKKYQIPYRVEHPLAKEYAKELICLLAEKNTAEIKTAETETAENALHEADTRKEELLCEQAVLQGKKLLLVGEQVWANSLRSELEAAFGGEAKLASETEVKFASEMESFAPEITAATWFMKKKELEQPGDVRIKSEADFIRLVKDGGYDAIVGDQILAPLVPFYEGIWMDLPHFALSGRMVEETK